MNTSAYAMTFSVRSKLLGFSSVGHCLELYDHTIYGVMLPFLAIYFFPAADPITSLFFAFLSFTLGFIIAPMGALFWGWYSDKFGRLSMLRVTMLIMAVPSLGIALLPTYEHIGVCAPVFLILFRMMQSISASGEIIGAKIFVMESLGQNENGFASGVVTAIGALGVLLAMGMGYLCTFYQDIENFWRIPFLVGSSLFIIGQFIRRRLADKFLSIQKNENTLPTLKGTFGILKSHPMSSLIVLSLGAILGIMSYTLHAFINPYLIQQGISKSLVYQYSIIGLICTMLAAIVAGYYADKNKKIYENLFVIMFMYSLLAMLFFIFIQRGGWQTLICYMGFAGLLGAYACLSGIVMYHVFVPQIRCRGILFNYALGCATFGSLTPLTLNFLSGIHAYLPGVALTFCGFFFLFVTKRCVAKGAA